MAKDTERTVIDQVRVLKPQVEATVGRKIALSELIMPWLTRWAAMSVPHFQLGKDGKSPYEREKGR